MMVRMKVSKSSGIYQIQSKTNGNFYIGSACNLYARKNMHFNDLKKGKHHSKFLQRHYNKYGKEDLCFGILEFCIKDKLLQREQYYIDTLKPVFNTCLIAGSPLGIKHTKKARINMSLSHIGLQSGEKHPFFGKHHDEITNQKISETKKKFYKTEKGINLKKKLKELGKNNFSGKNNPRYGIHEFGEKTPHFGHKHSEETKRNYSIARTGLKQSKHTIEKRAEKVKGQFRVSVNQYNLNGEFIKTCNGYNEISKTGANCANVFKCIKGERKKAGGFIWKKAG